MRPLPLPDMAYLRLRRGKRRSGNRYYVRIAVPNDLREQFGTSIMERSLETSNLGEAKTRRHGELARILDSFERARRKAITSADIEHEAQRYLREQLDAIQSNPGDNFEPITDDFGNVVGFGGKDALATLREALQEQDWTSNVREEAERVAQRYGVTLTKSQLAELCGALQRAEIEAYSRAIAIHARVSTDGQTVETQLEELRAVAERHGWEIVGTYADRGVSGTKGREGRPEFDKLLKAVARRDVDMVAAWSVDRLVRSLQHLIPFLSDLQAKGVDLFLLRQGLDTSTPSGRAMFQMLGVFAEFEAAMIRERVRAGVARAKRNGTKSGQPIGRPKLDANREAAVRRSLQAGKGILKTAKALGIGTGTVARIANELRS